MSQPTSISDCMRRNPLTIHCEASLVQAIEMIFDYKLTGLTVTDDEGCAVGILSELDCMEAVLNAIYNDGDPEPVSENLGISRRKNFSSRSFNT